MCVCVCARAHTRKIDPLFVKLNYSMQTLDSVCQVSPKPLLELLGEHMECVDSFQGEPTDL